MAIIITDKCAGCQMCKKACPVEAITGELKMPHFINDKRCLDCKVCGYVCPNGAIVDDFWNVIEKISKSDMKKPIINKRICSACQICVDACGHNALWIVDKGDKDINVYAALKNPSDCKGCAICETECPLSAIRMEVPE